LRALASALAAAHAVHVLHHDVKPGNVLLGRDGAIRLTDFGVASFVSRRCGGPCSERPGYMPPETLRGKGFDHSGDLFALGAVAYRCLTGHSAFGGRTRPTP
jgi:serine/threonine-protein kinase